MEKIQQVGAAAEQDMLAIVNPLPLARREKRRSASSQDRPLFHDLDFKTGFRQTSGGSQAREAPSEDDYPWNGCHPGSSPALYRNRILAAWSNTSSFSISVKAACREKTLPRLRSMVLRMPR